MLLAMPGGCAPPLDDLAPVLWAGGWVAAAGVVWVTAEAVCKGASNTCKLVLFGVHYALEVPAMLIEKATWLPVFRAIGRDASLHATLAVRMAISLVLDPMLVVYGVGLFWPATSCDHWVYVAMLLSWIVSLCLLKLCFHAWSLWRSDLAHDAGKLVVAIFCMVGIEAYIKEELGEEATTKTLKIQQKLVHSLKDYAESESWSLALAAVLPGAMIYLTLAHILEKGWMAQARGQQLFCEASPADNSFHVTDELCTIVTPDVLDPLTFLPLIWGAFLTARTVLKNAINLLISSGPPPWAAEGSWRGALCPRGSDHDAVSGTLSDSDKSTTE